VVTVVQLRAERRRAFRAVRTSLNKVRKAQNSLHRQLDRRLEGHYTELLDVQDAQKVVDYSQALDTLWQEYKTAVAGNLRAFFE
jgi:hypothetical protein